jgi:hypothetical protein
MRVLDLCCGRLGLGRVFAARGHEVVGIDIVDPPEVPHGCTFIKRDLLTLDVEYVRQFDFGWASTPCEEFSVHGMKHFHPNPPFPDMGIVLFCYTRRMLQRSGIPFVMENVRAAQKFVGDAVNHCGPFYLWGSAVPPILPQGVKKGFVMGRDPETGKRILAPGDVRSTWSGSKERIEAKARTAIIPPELATAVCDYAERLMEVPA